MRSHVHVHWAWVPAGVFMVVVGVLRWGWAVTVAIVLGGLGLAAYAEWRARRRDG